MVHDAIDDASSAFAARKQNHTAGSLEELIRSRIFTFTRTHQKEADWTPTLLMDWFRFPKAPEEALRYIDFAVRTRAFFENLERLGILYWLETTRIKGIEEDQALIESSEDSGFYVLEPKQGRKMARLHTRFPAYRFFHIWSVGQKVHARGPNESRIYRPGVIVDILEPRITPPEADIKLYYGEEAPGVLRRKKPFQRPRYVVAMDDGSYVVLEDNSKFAPHIRIRQ